MLHLPALLDEFTPLVVEHVDDDERLAHVLSAFFVRSFEAGRPGAEPTSRPS